MSPAVRAYMELHQPVTALQIATALGITRQAFYIYRKEMHVVEWERAANGYASGLYVLGRGYNARRPSPLSQVERSKAYNARHSAMIRARRPSKTSTAFGPWKGLI
jgi:hypothetical protein